MENELKYYKTENNVFQKQFIELEKAQNTLLSIKDEKISQLELCLSHQEAVFNQHLGNLQDRMDQLGAKECEAVKRRQREIERLVGKYRRAREVCDEVIM